MEYRVECEGKVIDISDIQIPPGDEKYWIVLHLYQNDVTKIFKIETILNIESLHDLLTSNYKYFASRQVKYSKFCETHIDDERIIAVAPMLDGENYENADYETFKAEKEWLRESFIRKVDPWQVDLTCVKGKKGFAACLIVIVIRTIRKVQVSFLKTESSWHLQYLTTYISENCKVTRNDEPVKVAAVVEFSSKKAFTIYYEGDCVQIHVTYRKNEEEFYPNNEAGLNEFLFDRLKVDK
jgi:hypothetical protein